MRRRKRRQHIAKQGGQRLAAELRGQDLGRVLIVPIDGGKQSHKALIANALGDIITDTFEFGNDFVGASEFDKEVQRAARQAEAVHIFVGVEPTGHYVENFVQELLERKYEVRELNPFAVRCEREAGLSWCKTDDLDLCAMGQLLLNGKGRAAGSMEALYYNLRQAGRARRSSVRRRGSIQQQIHCYMDRLFPGLLKAEILGDPFGATCLAFMSHYGSAHRVKRSGKARLNHWLTQHHVRQAQEKAAALIELGARCVLLPPSAEEALLQVLRFRLEEHKCLSKQIRVWEERMAEYLVETPGIWLLSIREISVPSAAEYMGELGPLQLYEGAANIIGRAGLVSKKRQSATSSWEGGITKLGHPRLRYCLGIIGRNLIRRNTYFVRFYRRLVEQSGKEPRLAMIAVACKFVRISWVRMKLKGAFVPPAGEDLNQDIEKKYKEFLQNIGAGQLYQSKLGPRLRQVLEAGGYRRPISISRERASGRAPKPMGGKCTDQAVSMRQARDRANRIAASDSRQCVGNPAHLGEILRTHPVLKEVMNNREKTMS
jgi:transposase